MAGGMRSDDRAPRSVVRWLHELAGRRGNATAVVVVSADGRESVTSWQALAARATAAARLLHAHGVVAGDLVAVALPKSIDHLAATFGAWYLGARPLMLNPDLPPVERQRVVDLAAPAVVVADPDWLGSGALVVQLECGQRGTRDGAAGAS